MKVMYFDAMIMKQKLTASDERLVEVICSSNETGLDELYLGNNQSYWQNKSLRTMMWDFVMSQ